MVHAASTRAPRIAARTGATAANAAPAAGLRDDGLREVRGPPALQPQADSPAGLGDRLGERGADHRDDGRRGQCCRRQRRRPQRSGDAEREERQDGDEEPRAGAPAPERQEVRAVVDEEREAHGKRQRRLAPRVATAERQEPAQPGDGERRQDEQPLVGGEELRRRAQARERDAEEPLVVRADHVVPALAGLDHGVLVRELERAPERPRVEGQERHDADDRAERDRTGGVTARRTRRVRRRGSRAGTRRRLRAPPARPRSRARLSPRRRCGDGAGERRPPSRASPRARARRTRWRRAARASRARAGRRPPCRNRERADPRRSARRTGAPTRRASHPTGSPATSLIGGARAWPRGTRLRPTRVARPRGRRLEAGRTTAR